MQSQYGKYSAFGTVSDEAAFVISKMMPTDILADEMATIYNMRFTSLLTKVKNAEKKRSVNR